MSYVISGTATWYDSCLGGANDNFSGGACGNCQDGWAHMAWPALSTTGCFDNCGHNCTLACQQVIQTQDQCTALLRDVRAVDCCPCRSQGGSCTLTPYCGGTAVNRPDFKEPLADFTSGMMLDIHGNLTDGRVEVQFVGP